MTILPVGRTAGFAIAVFGLMLVPMIDVGIAQNAMFGATLPSWGKLLPAHGAVQVLLDGAFTPGFSDTGALMLALGWVLGITTIASLVFRRVAEPRRA